MQSLFLIPTALPAPNPVSKAAINPNLPVDPNAANASPFDFSLDQWQSMATLSWGVQQVAPVPPGGGAQMQALIAAFNKFLPSFAQFFSTVLPGVCQLAAQVAEYGTQTVPQQYGALNNLLADLENRAPTPDDRRVFDSLLGSCMATATHFQAIAAGLQGPIVAFADSATDLLTQQKATPLSLKVQIFPDVGGAVALGVSDDYNSVMGRNTDVNDPKQLWDVIFNRQHGAYQLSITTPGGVRSIAQASQPIQILSPAVLGFANMQLSTQLEPQPTMQSLWTMDTQSNGCIRMLLYSDFCMDISGNSGWGHGTPVLSFRVNDGGNQHWSCQPKPYLPAYQFFVAQLYQRLFPVSSAAAQNAELLEGAWTSVAADLQNVSNKIGSQIDSGKPFKSELVIDGVIHAWQDIGTRANDLVQNANRIQPPQPVPRPQQK